MTQINWIQAELSKHYPNADFTVGVDLDQNDTIIGSEITDQDRNGVVSDPEWQRFMIDNQAALEKLGGRFKEHYSNEEDSGFLAKVEEVVGNIFLGLLTVAVAPFGIVGCSSPTENYFCVPTWTEHTIDGDHFPKHLRSVYAADVDNDGDMDILGRTDEIIAWWENLAGDGSAWTEHTIEEGDDYDGDYHVESIYATDMDGDDDLDILGGIDVLFVPGDFIAWWENTAGDGSAWTQHTIIEGDDADRLTRSVYAADMDGDHDLDILGGGGSGLAWWENTAGDGSTWDMCTVNSLFGAYSIYAADMDGDGEMDILGGGNKTMWWENADGDGSTWTEHMIDAVFDGTLSAVDMDRDGDMDVLGAEYGWYYDGFIAWWENTDGNGKTWSEHTIAEDLIDVSSAYAADLDDDGDMDVLGAEYTEGIAWWENLAGDGSDWIEYTIEEGGDWDAVFRADSVYAADMDGDDDLDVLGGGAYGIAWWESECIE